MAEDTASPVAVRKRAMFNVGRNSDSDGDATARSIDCEIDSEIDIRNSSRSPAPASPAPLLNMFDKILEEEKGRLGEHAKLMLLQQKEKERQKLQKQKSLAREEDGAFRSLRLLPAVKERERIMQIKRKTSEDEMRRAGSPDPALLSARKVSEVRERLQQTTSDINLDKRAEQLKQRRLQLIRQQTMPNIVDEDAVREERLKMKKKLSKQTFERNMEQLEKIKERKKLEEERMKQLDEHMRLKREIEDEQREKEMRMERRRERLIRHKIREGEAALEDLLREMTEGRETTEAEREEAMQKLQSQLWADFDQELEEMDEEEFDERDEEAEKEDKDDDDDEDDDDDD